MKTKRLFLGILTSLALTPTCWAQLPGIPPVAPPPPGIPAIPAAPATPNLWTFLLPNAQQKANCKTCFCNSPIGQLTSAAMGPMSMFTGGLMTNRCAQNAIANDLLKPATSSEGAAAAIKKDEAEAGARRAAVRYLGTVDCNYWPEATEALRMSLRADRNECVRFEAALALRSGCCCNEKTMKALAMCISGSDRDGHPGERSERVRAAAAEALSRCPLIEKEIVEPEKNGGDIKKTDARPVNPDEFYARVSQMSREELVSNARGVLVKFEQSNRAAASGQPIPANGIQPVHPRAGSLSEIVSNAFGPNGAPVAVVAVRQPQGKPMSLYELVSGRNINMRPEFMTPNVESVVPVQANILDPRANVQSSDLRSPMPIDSPREAGPSLPSYMRNARP